MTATVLSIKATDIDNWTSKNPRRAQELLPKLIWKLILASSKIINDHHFPFEKAVQYAGYDGYLITPDTNSFYPNGASVWEFGTDENIKSKINSDYQKRSNNPGGINPKTTTICFVTSRIWNHKEGITEFTNAKQNDNIWKDVRILDANNLEMWLDECPSVAVWFSKIIEKPYNDIMSLQDYWDYIVNKTDPKLNTEFFCYGRDTSIADEILDMLDSGHSQITLSAESKIEGILTFAASLLNDTNIKKQQLLSRTVIALSSEGFFNICRNYKNAIIIPTFKNEMIQLTTDNILICPTENNGPIDLLYKNSPKSTITPRRRKVFSEALEKLGYDINEANTIAGDVKCRFSPLLRRITSDMYFKLPLWASDTNISVLVPALLANAWEENLEGDKTAIEILSGQKYDDYISSIEKYTQGDNMPLFRLVHSFACISVNELWDVVAPHINNSYFENYKKCVAYIFTEVDPMYELPEEKWAAAGVYGKKSKFSEHLKRGLILAMTKIVELDEKERFFNFADCTIECHELVFNIYNRLTTKNQWRTLVPYIADFVEATPEAIINILETNAEKSSDAFWCLFKSPSDLLFGRSFYTYILWALEKLVWLKEYSVRSINLLVALEQKNFKYKLTNSPMDSLLKIFCFGHPQGVLSPEERDTLLTNIIDNHRSIGRKLINKLLPNGNTMTTNLSKFNWRYVEYTELLVTDEQYKHSIKFVATRFAQSIGPNYEDWKTVVKYFSIFYSIFAELKIDIIKKGLELPESERLRLCAKMASIISRNRKFANESDTADLNITNEMEELYKSLLPNSSLKYAHYYSHDFYGLNPSVFRTEGYDYDKEKDELGKLRIVALEDTLDQFKLDAILTLAQNVDEITFLIDSLINSKYFQSINMDFIIKAHLVCPQFAERFVNSIYYAKGLSFFVGKLNDIPDSDVKWIISQFPIRPDVVAFLDAFSHDVQDEFWASADAWRIMYCNDVFARDCINTLLKYHRPYTVIREIYLADCSDVNLILDALQAALDYHPNTERNGINLNNIDNYYIEKLFENVYKGQPSDIMRVSQLELAYMNKLNMDFEPKCLVENALSNPHVFIELISYGFKKDDGNSNEIPQEKEFLIHLAYEALSRIKRLPGQTEDLVDTNKFNVWIHAVLALAKELKYITACEIQIGTILSYSPIDEDGIWPHKCVRDFLEKNNSDIISTHICIGLFNQRGVHNVTGGDEEERIAATYSEYAQKLQLLYPKTSRVVKNISDDYKRESKFERTRELKGSF